MSTSELQRQVSELLEIYFGEHSIYENIRPDWVLDATGRRLEFDFFIPSLRIALEIQGQQHFTYIPYFHGDFAGFLDQLERDKQKRAACTQEQISLFEITSRAEAVVLFRGIQLMLKTPRHYTPVDSTLLRELGNFQSIFVRKGLKASVKVIRLEAIQQRILDMIAVNSALITQIDPQVGNWIMSMIQHNFDRLSKLKHKNQHARSDAGFITVYSIEGFFRILYTTKTPERQLYRLNQYRTGHKLIYSQYFENELKSLYAAIVLSCADVAVTDALHKDGWFKLDSGKLHWVISELQHYEHRSSP